MNKTLKILSDIFFYLALVIAAVVLANRFTGKPGFQLLSVTSGSMEPYIKTGSVVLIKPEANYLAGDVITFRSGPKTTTTHRIVFKNWPQGLDNPPQFLTSGDANPDMDVTPVTLDQIVGRQVLTVPFVGYLAGQAKTPVGFILLVIVPGTIIIYEELKSILSQIRLFWQKTVSTTPSTPFHKALVMIPIISAVCLLTTLTGAYFSDSIIVDGNSLGALIPTP